MSIWLCRANNKDEAELCLKGNRIYCSWHEFPLALSSFDSPQDLESYVEYELDIDTETANNLTDAFWSFAKEIQRDDLVILYCENDAALHFGAVSGEYDYDMANSELWQHSLPVQWFAPYVPRASIEKQCQPLTKFLNSSLALCEFPSGELLVKSVLLAWRDDMAQHANVINNEHSAAALASIKTAKESEETQLAEQEAQAAKKKTVLRGAQSSFIHSASHKPKFDRLEQIEQYEPPENVESNVNEDEGEIEAQFVEGSEIAKALITEMQNSPDSKNLNPKSINFNLQQDEVEEAPDQNTAQAYQDIIDCITMQDPRNVLGQIVLFILRGKHLLPKVNPASPDDRMEIIASTSDGADPKLCVQIYFANEPLSANALDNLNNLLHTFCCKYGILVSWQGYSDELVKLAAKPRSHFVLWSQHDIVKEFIGNYEAMSPRVKRAVPLNNKKLVGA